MTKELKEAEALLRELGRKARLPWIAGPIVKREPLTKEEYLAFCEECWDKTPDGPCHPLAMTCPAGIVCVFGNGPATDDHALFVEALANHALSIIDAKDAELKALRERFAAIHEAVEQGIAEEIPRDVALDLIRINCEVYDEQGERIGTVYDWRGPWIASFLRG